VRKRVRGDDADDTVIFILFQLIDVDRHIL